MLISLVVPTRERAQYLGECLRTAVAIRDPDVEIIVSDNVSQDDTRAVVEGFGDSRIRYCNTGARISMRQNFEFALDRSSGDYVIYIGDDDAFLPGQFAALRTLLERDRPELVSWKPLTYGWPVPGFGRRVGGVRFAREQLLGLPRELPLAEARAALLRCDLVGVGPHPAVYHGCVSRAYLESIRGRCGFAFGARAPDVFFSYFAMLTRKSFPWARHSFTISGYSPVSTGNASHAYKSSDPRAWPVVRWTQESVQDPVQDAVRTTSTSLPILLFSYFETARVAAGVDAREVDYTRWYEYVVGSTNKADLEQVREVDASLDEYARATNTSGELAQARAARPGRRSSTNPVSKLVRNLTSIKCSAARAGTNTVRTAAELVDEVLGDEYLAMAQSGAESALAWPRAYARVLRRKLIP